MTLPASQEADLIDSECDLVSALSKAPHVILMCSQGFRTPNKPTDVLFDLQYTSLKSIFKLFFINKKSINLHRKQTCNYQRRKGSGDTLGVWD